MGNRYTTIVLNDEVALHPDFINLRHQRKLSSTINNLLSQHLSIKKSSVPTQEEDINQELQEISVRRAVLLEKRKEIESSKPTLTEKEKSEGWFIFEGKKMRSIQ